VTVNGVAGGSLILPPGAFATMRRTAAGAFDVDGPPDASAVAYSNSVSGLAATNAQAAIDEVVGLIPSGGGDTFISQMQRWGAIVVQAGTMGREGCFGGAATGVNLWTGASTSDRRTNLFYTLGWARAQTIASINAQVAHFSGSAGSNAAASKFDRKNSLSSNHEGFLAKIHFGMTGGDFGTPAVIKSDYRFFAGVLLETTIDNTVDPSTLVNCFGVGKDSADSNWQLMHNDGSGSCTKVDLGSGLEATAIDLLPFELRISAPRGGTSVTWSLIRLDTFAVAASGTVTTDLIDTDVRVATAYAVNNGPNNTTRVGAYLGGTFMRSDFATPS
jgi:hypothetical protein